VKSVGATAQSLTRAQGGRVARVLNIGCYQKRAFMVKDSFPGSTSFKPFTQIQSSGQISEATRGTAEKASLMAGHIGIDDLLRRAMPQPFPR
jgi:hypothetical protein